MVHWPGPETSAIAVAVMIEVDEDDSARDDAPAEEAWHGS